ncbi:MAG: flagellar type III secretion system pore protein FliP [Planctomycetaceae bacterium]|nr:flagellar type III secretion system pore protein FliP [Planctomycetaceae bacterium]MCP4463766.1 flagellar type III secretion system pore protein FliP [Planctomycetaceae bacterium]MDG1808135.1 flagellar type III secretion system pore protein FliP [Pirellulaceae bacterium]MDG2103868.1 flagellar type III secretion system pore protein FliP [Pirellulaceae bacterium]
MDVVFDAATQSEGFQELAAPLQLALFLGGMVLLAGALVSLTAFTRIVIVLSFVRRALATQEIPPNPVIIGLSLFLTLFVMGPTINAINDKAITPMVNGEIQSKEALTNATTELRGFMLNQTRKRDLILFLELSKEEDIQGPEDTPMRALIPAFIISELKTAFIMGFCIYVPFLLIDLVISTVLMSLGMMMMPPMIVSTPCKILLFVLVDGWHLVVMSLSQSFIVQH